MLVALAFDFMNGFHDAANSIATVVSTRVLKPYQAVMLAAFFNFVALFVFHLSVATTIGKGIIDQGIVDHYVVFGALIGAIAWNVITWYYGIPSSSSHALIGGLVGAAVAKAGTWALIPAGILKTVAFIFISPLLGMVLGALLMLAVSWIFVRVTPSARRPLVPAAAARLGLALQPRPRRQRRAEDHRHHLDAADRRGLHRRAGPGADLGGRGLLRHHRASAPLFGGWRIVKTMGQRITKLKPVGGFCAETGGRDRRCSSPPPSAFRCPPRTPSPARSSASARRRRSRRCAGAWPATCSGRGS